MVRNQASSDMLVKQHKLSGKGRLGSLPCVSANTGHKNPSCTWKYRTVDFSFATKNVIIYKLIGLI